MMMNFNTFLFQYYPPGRQAKPEFGSYAIQARPGWTEEPALQ